MVSGVEISFAQMSRGMHARAMTWSVIKEVTTSLRDPTRSVTSAEKSWSRAAARLGMAARSPTSRGPAPNTRINGVKYSMVNPAMHEPKIPSYME